VSLSSGELSDRIRPHLEKKYIAAKVYLPIFDTHKEGLKILILFFNLYVFAFIALLLSHSDYLRPRL